MQLGLTPLANDPRDLGLQDGKRIWGAYSCDPALIATLRGGGAIAPGWYRASVTLDGRSGDIDRPRLYIPDAGGGYSEPQSLELKRHGSVYQADFFLAHEAHAVRLDPSVYPCEFTCDLSLERLAHRPFTAWAQGGMPGGRVFRKLWHVGVASPRELARSGLRELARRKRAIETANRKKRVLAAIDRNGLGMEIGPSHNPIAPKREGFNVHIVDHASREELRQKYAAHPIALDVIEEVDFVWKGQTYLELTGTPKRYDWIIASHLIEHTPDLIDFLANCDAVLKDDGVLCLVIPDKRYCFDRFRPITGLSRVIDAHLSGSKIHSVGITAEYFMNVVRKDHELSWEAGAPGDYVFEHSAHLAKEMIREVRENGTYLDIHDWCFVPHSFRLLLNDLNALGYTRLREVSFSPTEGQEFYVTLGRLGKGPDKSRLEILQAIEREISGVDDRSRLAWLARMLRPPWKA